MANDREKPVLEVDGNSAGRVAVDGRGRNVWQWNEEQLDSTTIMLSRLDNDSLELEPTRSVPIPGAKPAADDRRKKRDGRRESCSEGLGIDATLNIEAGAGAGGGFDPYNRS